MYRFKILFVAALAAVSFMAAPKARADVNDYVINDFHGRYELSNDIHAGRLKITETIKLTYSAQNRGILRAIPVDYRGNSLKLDIKSVMRDGQDEPYTTYGQANNEVLKIGDADTTITGQHTYQIQYEIRNIVDFYKEYDEWYWDMNGDQWQQPFEKVHGEVIVPEDWSTDGIPSASCYTGSLGSTKSVCKIEKSSSGYTFEAFDKLDPGETLTVAVPFQKGLFTPRDRTDWLRDNTWQLVGIATGLTLGGVSFRQWWKWGKGHKGRGTIVPEYSPPKGLTPAEVGLLYDFNVDSRDLTATIIDLAVRGYIKIHHEEKKILKIFNTHDFTVELTNQNLGSLKPHEKSLIEALFIPTVSGTKQKLDDLDKTKMYSAVTEIRRQMKDSLTNEHGLLEESPTRAWVIQGVVIAASVILIFVSGAGWGWLVGMALAAVSSFIFFILMRRRSHAGVAEYEKIQGLKLYMDTVEKDRLKMMQGVDRPYSEPSHNVELFENLLPFAIALGVEKSWAKQFDNIYSQPPSWYTGNMAAFNTVYFTNSLASSASAFNSSFSTSTSSSSSGSGGGGFAGGGGGGGGGGGW